MRTRTASLAIASIAALLIAASPVAARSSTPVSITLFVNLEAGVETVTAHTNFCDATAESDTRATGIGRQEKGTVVFHVVKVFTCTNGSTITIALHAAFNRPHGSTTGGWTIVDGTGMFEGASGGGSIVGVFVEDGIIDQYEGVIVR